jgi:glycosyltransferase involved in cell wall biosynthesis
MPIQGKLLRMKILHVISSGGMYGAEAVILNMSRTLNEGGRHSSELAVFSNSSNPNLELHETAAREGIRSNLISCRGQVDRKVVNGIRELAGRVGADIVHAHGYKADIYVYLALRGRRIPLVSTCHTWYDNDPFVSLYGWADRGVLRNFARVVAVSDEVRQRLLRAGVREERIRLLQNGIDLRPFDKAAAIRAIRAAGADSMPVVGLIGRLAPEKGVDIFLRATAQVLAEFPGARFVVAGEGPDRDKLEALIDALKIREWVELVGRQEDMPAVYASLDLMVSSSRQEGLPIAILEGMASGLPLVAARVGEVPRVVMDGVTGILVPPEDTGALAEAIVGLLRDPERRERLGAAGRRLVEEKYSAARMTEDYLRVYEEAIAVGGRGK